MSVIDRAAKEITVLSEDNIRLETENKYLRECVEQTEKFLDSILLTLRSSFESEELDGGALLSTFLKEASKLSNTLEELHGGVYKAQEVL